MAKSIACSCFAPKLCYGDNHTGKKYAIMPKSTRTLLTGGALAIGAFALVPSIGLAVASGTDSNPVSLSARGGIGSFTPASIDPKLASELRMYSKNARSTFRFTPAKSEGALPQSVTVAVRVRGEKSNAVSVRSALPKVGGKESSGTPVAITKTAFSLGVAKGWQKFALPGDIKDIKAPDLSAMKPVKPAEPRYAKKPSRFRPNVEVDAAPAPGSVARTLDGEEGYTVDVGGSYKLTRNLDVTAGVRISNERDDRLDRLTTEQQDSQAVYVGTQFRF